MLSEEAAEFFNHWADLGIAVCAVLYLSFVVTYGIAYQWRRTRAGRSVFFSFLSLLAVSAISFLAVWVGEDFWLRPVWRALAWTAASAAAVYLLYALLRRWNKGGRIVIEPKTGSLPVTKEESDG